VERIYADVALLPVPASAEQFKTLGFVVKRGLIPRDTLLPWVDKLWQTVEQQTDKFKAVLARDDPSTWHDIGEHWTNWSDRGHGRDLIHLTPNSQWRWCDASRPSIQLQHARFRA
jgi:hypothetical protein